MIYEYQGKRYRYWRHLFLEHFDTPLAELPQPQPYHLCGLAGVPPRGYSIVTGERTKRICVDSAVAPLIQEGFIKMIEPWTPPRTVWQRAVKQGLMGTWGNPISYTSFRKIMLNPFYMGLVQHRGELYQGSHEPLVSEDVFKAARRRLLYLEQK